MPIHAPRICACGHRVAHADRCACEEQKHQAAKARSDAKRPSASARGYDGRWSKARRTYLASRPMCCRCPSKATVVDHVIAHRGDQALFWDKANWQPLCARCHNVGKQAGERRLSMEAQKRIHPFGIQESRIPVTIVCGPPGAGKSTYVTEHAGPNDLVIDLDVIRSTLAGTAIHQGGNLQLAPALDERNRLLRSLPTDTVHDRCWFIIAAPNPEDRAAWQRKLAGSLIVLDPGYPECERRIRADATRKGNLDGMLDLCRDWYRRAGRIKQHTLG